jgi:hypothetical protein
MCGAFSAGGGLYHKNWDFLPFKILVRGQLAPNEDFRILTVPKAALLMA